VAHRPWPVPAGPWVMVQVWHDLLFAHWPIAFESLQPLGSATTSMGSVCDFLRANRQRV